MSKRAAADRKYTASVKGQVRVQRYLGSAKDRARRQRDNAKRIRFGGNRRIRFSTAALTQTARTLIQGRRHEFERRQKEEAICHLAETRGKSAS